MEARRRPTTRMLAYFLLLLAGQLYAYPTQMPPTDSPSDLDDNWHPTSAYSPGIINNPLQTDGRSSDPNDMLKSFRRVRETERLNGIRLTIENGDILDENSMNAYQAPVKGIPRDTGHQEETQASSISLQTHAINRSQGQQGQRRLFGAQNAPSMALGSDKSDGKIVFPSDDGTIGVPHKFSARPPPICQGATFCERAAFYPENLINQAMQLNDTLKFLAGVDVVSDIEQRIDVQDDVPLCLSTEQVVYPKSAENKRKEWLFVVNQDNFKQGIRIETCSTENRECSVIDGLAEGYRTACKQKYIYRQLAAISNDGTVAPDMFRFPSSCCCHVKFTGNPLTRIGLIGEQRSQSPVPQRRRRK